MTNKCKSFQNSSTFESGLSVLQNDLACIENLIQKTKTQSYIIASIRFTTTNSSENSFFQQ